MATLLLASAACDGGSAAPPDAPSAPPDVADLTCPVNREKIVFDRAHGCYNDGLVTFEVPTADTQGIADAKAVGPNIRCSEYMGGITVCTYQFDGDYDAHCLSIHGAMTESTWADMCSLAAIDGVSNIRGWWGL
jgi:hypothetical protein